MAIKRIRVSNFKSFKEIEVELGRFNVLIGANASGKSNFVQVFQFLRDLATHGLEDAISMQGSVSYLRNINIGASENFSLEVVSRRSAEGGFLREKEKDLIGMTPYEVSYKMALEFNKIGMGFRISEDKLTQKIRFSRLKSSGSRGRRKIKKQQELGKGTLTTSAVGGRVKYQFEKDDSVPLETSDLVLPFFQKGKLPSKTTLIENQFFFVSPFADDFDISIYDFDPKLPKKAVPITGKADLEEDGSNLALVLNNVLRNREGKRKFTNLIRDLLPFVEDVATGKFAPKSLLFKLREIYFKSEYLPASLISDGTINITALLVALYFEKKPIAIIEEPERNIHPKLISRVVDMMKDVSQRKQIIVTTHNPEVVKHAGLENILLVSRDKEGFSTILKPSDSKEVRVFLEHEMGVEELFVEGLLETSV